MNRIVIAAAAAAAAATLAVAVVYKNADQLKFVMNRQKQRNNTIMSRQVSWRDERLGQNLEQVKLFVGTEPSRSVATS